MTDSGTRVERAGQPAARPADLSGVLLDRMSRACRPNLFDVVADPQLLIALILANLTSPVLWELGERIAARREPGAPGPSLDDVMLGIQSYTDQHLFHISPLGVAETWGLLDLDEERERLGKAVVDYAVGEIVENLHARADLGTLTTRQDIFAIIDSGRFPEYHYSNIDIIRAYPRLLGRRKHRPIGVTTCADEAVLMASLCAVLHGARVADTLILGAPVHYTVLISHAGEACWLNGKHEAFTENGWRRFVANQDSAGIQRAVDTRMACDRIIAPMGACVIPDAWSAIPRPELDTVCTWLDDFFTTTLDWVAAIRGHPPRFIENPLTGFDWDRLDTPSDALSARALLRGLAREYPGSIFEAALYAARDLGVARPEVYLRAGARGHLVRARAARVTTIEDALDVLRRIDGNRSAVACSHCIALPDEVLKFDTGDSVDRAFLLCTIAALATALPGDLRNQREILITPDGAFVRLGPTCIRMNDLATGRIPANPIQHIAASG